MQEITCPSVTDKCPTNADAMISVTDSTVVTKTHLFNMQVPNKDFDWNCKYKISIETAAQETLKTANSGNAGYLVVTT